MIDFSSSNIVFILAKSFFVDIYSASNWDGWGNDTLGTTYRNSDQIIDIKIKIKYKLI